jgi:NCS1 family nucleobase:cation symporter-1
MSQDGAAERKPVPPQDLQPARYFAANFAGEHVAGTEFVVGALFAAAGAPAGEVILGLLLGNALAVLTWAFVAAPIAVETRLTLYAYLEKIAGPGFIKFYSVINGVLFMGLAGAMITVSAAALRLPLGIETQTGWIPQDWRFAALAVAVGAVVVGLAAAGFRRLAQFASLVAPWMILMFLVGALALYPALAQSTGAQLPALSIEAFWNVLSTKVYTPSPHPTLGFWHIAAFAWVCNLAMHGALGDMTLLRFARDWRYGFLSAIGMFIGHFAAWICAGAMGAGAGLLLGRAITQLDSGDVAFQALGTAGILTVVIAGWTTSNPTLYRAGIAFQSLHPTWRRGPVTIAVGAVTIILACSPIVFTRLLDYVGLMGLSMSPVGAVIFAEHWLFPRLGLARYWNHYRGGALNAPALAAWIIGVATAAALNQWLGVHLFFLFVPTWAVSLVAYVGLAALLGARKRYDAAAASEAAERERRAAEQAYLSSHAPDRMKDGDRVGALFAFASFAGLAWCLWLGARLVFMNAEQYAAALPAFHIQLLYPTAFLLVAAALGALRMPRRGAAKAPASS